MMNHLLPPFLGIVIVVSVGQVIYLTWRLWPSLVSMSQRIRRHVHRTVHCPWCWHDLHVRRWYPMHWSSTMCAHHARYQRTQLTARRQAREAILRSAIRSEVVAMETDRQWQEVAV